jgi:hypothetical protein
MRNLAARVLAGATASALTALNEPANLWDRAVGAGVEVSRRPVHGRRRPS